MTEAHVAKEGPTVTNKEVTVNAAHAKVAYLMVVRKRDFASELGRLS